ncbi:MAG: response regulator [Planctomycetes bacterium]|nr:response regulator [Planctomycetota bacterium]
MSTTNRDSNIGGKPSLRDQPGKVNILLVDDRPAKQLALTAILEELGQNLVVAHSGKEALRLLLRDEFAVILLDVNMPVMDGFETAALIRQRVRTEHTPIIFITAHNATDTHASKGYSLGAVDYIFAPVVPSILRAKILVFIDLYRQTEELARNEALFRRIFEEAPIGMALLDEGDRFQKVNQAFSAMLGYESEALGTMTHAAITHPDDRKRESKEAVRLARGEGAAASLDKRYLDKDGKEVWASTTTIRIRGTKGKEAHRLVMAKDITDTQHIQELERLTYQLQRTNAELEQFAYVAAHDLQEPLRMISSFLHLLEREMGPSLSAKAKVYFAHVTSGAERMRALVHSVLEFSRIDAESSEIGLIDTEDAVRREVAVLAETIAATRAVIEVGPLPSVRCSPAGMSRLIQNLLSNALKFSSKDAPLIRVAATASDGWVTISVRDNGIGIPPSQGGKLFILFQRLHTRNDYPGTGIGLASCKKIVENHGGRIWFESQPGHGTEFFFTLPGQCR